MGGCSTPTSVLLSDAGALDAFKPINASPADTCITQRQVAAHPLFALGGPSMGWLHEALVEMRALARRKAPALPAHTFLGTDEAIVEAAPIRARMDAWPGGVLTVLPGGDTLELTQQPS